jgi:hypothetical protein
MVNELELGTRKMLTFLLFEQENEELEGDK